MAEEFERLTRRELRSPRAAAIAGIVYSILIITVMLLTRRAGSVQPEDITRDFFDTWSGPFSQVLTLVPFAGIALLWFTGVIRDQLKDREDRFFATIFFGSGIIIVLLLFIWGALLGTIMRIATLETLGVIDSFSTDIYIYSIVLMNEIIGNIGLRMTGVYMTAVGTLWNRTKLMPRWITIITYILALGFLLAAERIREARFIFPVWVFVVSVYILILNYRSKHENSEPSDM
jgi:hypothetical protein